MYLSTSPSPTSTLTPIGPDFGATREEAACEATEFTLVFNHLVYNDSITSLLRIALIPT
jgi:hypothetical protein